ncbi:MAG: hypothetical protein HQL24_06995 [Candidatus Omnitrophica bacterium]|nr:hypothetical protein [Candidatus Omnitrophota bacterium]
MKKYLFLAVAILLYTSLSTFSLADATKTFVLKDGTVVKGEVIDFVNKIYFVKTANLGEIRVNDADIVSMVAGDATTASNPQNTQAPQGQATTSPAMQQPAGMTPENLQTKTQQVQAMIMSDPTAIQEMQALAQDPDVMSILSDKDAMKDITSYNQEKIQTNPKIKMLLNNPNVQKLIQRVGQRMAPPQQ